MTSWQTGLCTGTTPDHPFKPLNLQAAMFALISQFTVVCNMQLNVLDDLAEAMKALDGKKSMWSRDPGWGDPWFPHSAVLLHSHNGMASLTRRYGYVMFVFVFSLLSCFLPYQLSWYNVITSPSSLVSGLDRRSLSILLVCFVLVGVWLVCFLVLLLLLFVWSCVLLSVFLNGLWRLLDYVQVPHQFTFVASIPDGGSLYALIC